MKKVIFILVFSLMVFQGFSDSIEIISGIIKGGMMAIGGETTGFVLLNDKKRLEVSLPQTVIKNFSDWDGKEVTLKGKIIIIKGIERGQRRVFKASSIQIKGEGHTKLKVNSNKKSQLNVVSRVLKFFGFD